MKDGRVVQQGTFAKLAAQKEGELNTLLEAYGQSQDEVTEEALPELGAEDTLKPLESLSKGTSLDIVRAKSVDGGKRTSSGSFEGARPTLRGSFEGVRASVDELLVKNTADGRLIQVYPPSLHAIGP
eukprot:1191473-Prorocentrum_minimum.AAC.1